MLMKTGYIGRLFVNRNLFTNVIENMSNNSIANGYKMLCPYCHAIVNTKELSLSDWLETKFINRGNTKYSPLLPCGCKPPFDRLVNAMLVDEWLAEPVSLLMAKGYPVIDAKGPHNDLGDSYIAIHFNMTLLQAIVKECKFEIRYNFSIEKWVPIGDEKGEVYRFKNIKDGIANWCLTSKTFNPNKIKVPCLVIRTKALLNNLPPIDKLHRTVRDFLRVARVVPGEPKF